MRIGPWSPLRTHRHRLCQRTTRGLFSFALTGHEDWSLSVGRFALRQGTDTGTPRRENKNPLGSTRGFEVREQDLYLRFRLPVIVRRVKRGKAKLVVNSARLGEFLALSPEDIGRMAPLLSGPLPEKTHPTRMKIDYVALRTQYQQLLSDGTCATKAEVGRHLGVSRVWVSRVLKGINRNTS